MTTQPFNEDSTLEAVIPIGVYCYTHTGERTDDGRGVKIKLCPHWRLLDEYPYQMNGYCTYLKSGDFMDNGTSLLWDQVKECNVNIPDDWYEDEGDGFFA